MALSLCSECQTVEGKWREMTSEELELYSLPETGARDVCAECDSIGSLQRLREYDDGDER